MIQTFKAIGLGCGDLIPKQGKTLQWNVDHLLNHEAVELAAIIAIRSPERLEPTWGRFLEEDPRTRIVEKGLGANDLPGDTHLLRVEADEGWWARLPQRLFAISLSYGLSAGYDSRREKNPKAVALVNHIGLLRVAGDDGHDPHVTGRPGGVEGRTGDQQCDSH